MKPRIEGEIRNQTQDHFRESYNSNLVLATALITWLSSGTSCICNTLSEGVGEWVCSSQICVFTWYSSLWNYFGRLENVPPVPYYTLNSSKLEKLGLKFKPIETMFDDCIAWFHNKQMLWYMMMMNSSAKNIATSSKVWFHDFQIIFICWSLIWIKNLLWSFRAAPPMVAYLKCNIYMPYTPVLANKCHLGQ